MRLKWPKGSVDLSLHYSPEELGSEAGSIHVWLLDLDRTETGAAASSVLSSEELRRARRLKDPLLSLRSVARHILVRRVLAKVVNCTPKTVVFVEGACGKPSLATTSSSYGGLPNEVNFNVSHSENVLALAVARGEPVGIDIEVMDPKRGTPSFYRTWTQKEALAKLEGVGIAFRGTLPDVLLGAGETRELDFAGKRVMLSVAVR